MKDTLKDIKVVENPLKSKEYEFRCVVRISTTCYATKSGLAQKKTITFLKRKSDPDSLYCIENDISNIGAREVIGMIKNFENCEDGLYRIDMTDIGIDFESGYIDEYNYKLLKYE